MYSLLSPYNIRESRKGCCCRVGRLLMNLFSFETEVVIRLQAGVKVRSQARVYGPRPASRSCSCPAVLPQCGPRGGGRIQERVWVRIQEHVWARIQERVSKRPRATRMITNKVGCALG